MERCDNCLYEYDCDCRKAGEELRCEDWKTEVECRMNGMNMAIAQNAGNGSTGKELRMRRKKNNV